ncbi:MAG TPA: sigma factor-like helix-turn-helix DNA-binding protein [Acidimicrobiales bacterium]|nr:sigma factor-like helix-turn-helix DNA-binding protein [Acidimicrobiales bacterium]
MIHIVQSRTFGMDGKPILKLPKTSACRRTISVPRPVMKALIRHLYSFEDIEKLMDALGSLSHGERELIQLAYWEKLSYREIGVVIGCSEKAAGIGLSRVRRTLRERLNQSTTPIASLPLLQEEM